MGGKQGEKENVHLEHLPALQVPSSTAGPLCPTATLGSATAPLSGYQPVTPKAVSISTRLH